MSEIQNIEALISAGEYDKALVLLDSRLAVAPDDDGLLFLRGKLKWRLGRRAEAMSDYSAAAQLNPQSPAALALEHARDVEAFFNPDLYNP